MRLAIVVPRYGLDIAGGAETLACGFAEEMVRREWDIEVWTTCARSHYTWKNSHSSGQTIMNGVLVRRFLVDDWLPDERATIDVELSTRGKLPLTNQYIWLAHGPHSVRLYKHIAAHAADFDYLIMLPYASPLVQYAAWVAPEKTIVWPCLHNEPYAYMEPTSLLLENVWGVMFNAPEEGQLATETLGLNMARHAVLGVGVGQDLDLDTTVSSAVSQDILVKNLLYMGRLEDGKNLSILYYYVRRYVKEGGDIKLTLFGRGPLILPHYDFFDYRGFASKRDKARACASALALCQPSLNESFSLVIMESWLMGRPVLVHRDCAITQGHVQRSKGGLWFRTYEEFVAAFEWLRDHPQEATQMGANGRAYVRQNYTWSAVADRFEKIIQAWLTGFTITHLDLMSSGDEGG